MRLRFKISLLIWAFALTANAQIYFNKIYPYGALVANATSVIEIDTGGYLFPSSTFGSYSSLVINRINANGDTLFTKEYYKPYYSFSTGASNSIIHTYDNKYIFSGAIVDSSNNVNAFLVKITDSGDTLWTKNYGGANFDDANVVCQTPDSGFVLMGVTQSYSMGPASDFYLIKTDKNGNFQWQKTYGTAAAEDCISGQITLDGGYILSGRQSNMFHIVKTDSNGNFQWQQTYAGTEGVCFIKQLVDSSYILTGAIAVSGLGDQGCMIKINKTGGVIWQKNYGGTVNDWFYSIPIILNDGSIIVSGQTMLGALPIGMLVKTDSSGNQKWLRTYYNNTSVDEYFYDVKHTSDNGFIMSGFTTNGWLVKVDSNGCEIANCNLGIEEHKIENLMLNVYPNPATTEITISIENDNIRNYEIIVINILGKEQKIEKNTSIVSLSGFSSGIYFITAISKDGKHRLSQKFVKE